jgi:hypothetical protein
MKNNYITYRNTAKYLEKDTLHTDIDDYFVELSKRGYTAFMIEYTAPFKSVIELSKRSMLCGAIELSKKDYVVERLFING